MPEKPGIKTSEFQISLLAAALVGLLPVFFPNRFPLTPEQQAQCITVIVGLYAIGRSITKTSRRTKDNTKP